MKHICIVTPGYPSEINSAVYAFVGQLATAIADLGHYVDVITPASIWDKELKRLPQKWEQKTTHGNVVHVHRPALISFGKINLLGFNTMSLTSFAFQKAVEKTLKTIKKPDVLYAHFLAPAGVTVANIGEQMQTPSYCAFGESGLWSINYLKKGRANHIFKKLSGVISVSSDNKNVLLENGIIDDERKIKVIPNACDTSLFNKKDKGMCRKELGIEEGNVVGIFVGSFIERKGPLRVNKASEGIDNLKMIYVGSGTQKPEGDNIIYCGRVEHDRIPMYLSAADFFVLPTKAEGCCNAIVEALACGLPVISSDRSFNYDILDEKNSIMVNPESIEELRTAMIKMSEEPELRSQMSIAAEEKGRNMSIEERAKAIVRIMYREL